MAPFLAALAGLADLEVHHLAVEVEVDLRRRRTVEMRAARQLEMGAGIAGWVAMVVAG
ncbi:MAG: hypothetical protein V9G98_12940 [Candidatus Competibacter sp.]